MLVAVDPHVSGEQDQPYNTFGVVGEDCPPKHDKMDKPTYYVTMDDDGRVWVEHHGQRRCLFQIKGQAVIYRLPSGYEGAIGSAKIEGDQIALTIPIHS